MTIFVDRERITAHPTRKVDLGPRDHVLRKIYDVAWMYPYHIVDLSMLMRVVTGVLADMVLGMHVYWSHMRVLSKHTRRGIPQIEPKAGYALWHKHVGIVYFATLNFSSTRCIYTCQVCAPTHSEQQRGTVTILFTQIQNLSHLQRMGDQIRYSVRHTRGRPAT